MQVRAVGDGVTNVDANTELDTAVGVLITLMRANLLLHIHGTADGTLDAVAHHEERITRGVDDTAAMLGYRWIDQIPPQRPYAFECADIVQAD
jgi:hypothetical protein